MADKATVFCEVESDISALMGYYAACIGNFPPTFRNNLSVPSSAVTKSKQKAGNTTYPCITGFILGLLYL